jgi:GT2 family glycosyltransferase
VERAVDRLKDENYDAEVIVVDNNSVDGSVGEVRCKFPGVSLIENRVNLGFSKANNQAIARSSGRFVLLLNPDTVVEEDSFLLCIDFMDSHPDAGALGVKMIDGKGAFLPESKRSLPTPEVSFYKMFGLSSLFPRSRRFGKYNLSYLDPDSTHMVDVLAGAFMFLRADVLERTGYLDESFFMYGEDIDLSYRITQAGYRNYYYPGTTILHYKGESTKKGSLNYIRMFYQAMIIFAAKHFSSRKARSFNLLIHLAIYFRAALSVVRRFTSRIYRPLLDGFIIYLGYLFVLPFWEHVRFDTVDYYPSGFMQVMVPSYILIWLLSLFYSGAYDKPMRLFSFFKGHVLGTLSILVIYALLPLELRYSRALIFLGSLWAIIGTLGFRTVLHLAGVADYQVDLNKQKRIAIVGTEEEARRVSSLLEQTQARPEVVGKVSPSPVGTDAELLPHYIGHIDQIDEIVGIHRLDEIVFCSKDLESGRIISIMTRLIGSPVDFKIAPPESLSVIGSNSINTSGDLYTIHFNSIGKASNRRNKRLFDVASSLLLLICFPLWFLFVRGHFNSVGNTLWVLLGFRTWIAYIPEDPDKQEGAEGTKERHEKTGEKPDLPPLKKGILHPASHFPPESLTPDRINEINIVYSKDYRVLNDLLIIARNFRNI